MIAQHVSAIVTYPDFGDAMMPVFQQATKAGIPVSTYAWGYVTGPGTNYTTVVGEDTCKLGKTFAYVMNTQVKSGNIAFLGGFPGNPLSPAGRSASRRRSTPRSRSSRTSRRTGIRRRSRGSSPASSRSTPDLKGLSYEDALFMSQGGYAAYKAAEHPLQGRVHLPDGRVGAWAAWPTS